MKISELIESLEQLKKENGDMEVVMSVTDHTDWTYNFEFPGFDVGNVYDEDGDFDDETDYCVVGVSI
jgi:hypothetical protein